MGQSAYQNGDARASISPASGFTAVNSRHNDLPNGNTPFTGTSATTRAELLSKFFTNNERASGYPEHVPSRRTSNISTSRPRTSETKAKHKPEPEHPPVPNSASPNQVAIPNTPFSLLPYVKPSAAERFDDSGPYKAEMVSRMELLQRGDRVHPPCDRCRRLHMDCLKNLTACLGCTRKHAKCSWKDVTDDELRDYVPPEPRRDDVDDGISEQSSSQPNIENHAKRNYAQGVRDEELLGEEESDNSISDGEAPNINCRYSPIQVHVAGSLQSANGVPIKRDDSNDLNMEKDMEPEVRRDIAQLQANEPAALPSPPGAPIPPSASLPDLQTIRSEALPGIDMEQQKDLVPEMLPPPVHYDSSEYGTFSSINGNGTNHGLPNFQIDGPTFDLTTLEQPEMKPTTQVAYTTISAPVAAMVPMALMTSTTMESPVGRTEA